MKRIVLSIIIVLSCFVVQAEHSFELSNTLNGNQDYHYAANSHIILSTGFRAEPVNGREVVLDIDGYSVDPPQAGITGGTNQNNSNGVVGSLGGVVDVSQLGGAIYSIPIDLPMGLGDLTPSLSIVYNSQSHNGLLGWAWDLNGISAITRTGGTLYHDGFVSGVNYSQDRFCLDGKRLMKVSSNGYGGHGTSYRTEQDQLSNIVSYQESGINGPSYFRVWDADGTIYYYGSSADSKALKNNQNYVNIWLLKKVEDRNGNSMEYHYSIDSHSYQLTKITYSGNSGDDISPAFTVSFQYNDRDDFEEVYVGNQRYHQNKLLKKIIIKNGNATMYSYQFTYKAPEPQKGYYYNRLTEIKLSAGDEHLNPTKIEWGSNNYYINSMADVKLNVTTNGINNGFVNAVKFNGDFNGDGYTDVVATRPDSEGHYSIADIFINKGLGSDGNAVFEHIYTCPMSSNVSWIQVADFDGDGLDDVLFTDRIRRVLFPDQINAKIYLSKLLPSGELAFINHQIPFYLIPHDMVEAHLVGDFFGEGKSDILIQSVTESKIENSILITYDENEHNFILNTFPEHLPANRFYPADYNGDGITEILYKKSDGNTCMVKLAKSNGTYHYEEQYSGSPSNWNDCFPGDFNGDGMIDALFYTSGNTNPWTIHLSHKLGISGTSYPLPETFPYSSPGNYMFSLDQPHYSSDFIKVADFDGNGCSDLGLIKDNLFYVFYGPLRANGDNAPFANSQHIGTQQFGLYNNMTVALGNFLGQECLSYLGNNTISHLPPLTTRYEVKKTTDGMGRVTQFQYDYLMPNPNGPSSDDFYHLYETWPNRSQYTRCVAVPIRALKKVTKYNVKNKPVETRCFYEGAVLHPQGKGFMGFLSTRQEDYCNNQLQKKTIRRYDTEYSDHAVHLMMVEESVFDNSTQLMAKSTCYNTLYEHLRNNKVIIPLTNKTLEEYDADTPGRLIKKEIQETTVSTHCSQSLKYNDVLSIVSQTIGITDKQEAVFASQCDFQQITNTTYLPDILSSWVINRPATTTSIAHHKGDDDDICHHRVFTYRNNNSNQIASILDLPNDGSNPTDRLATMTSFQYDPCGNIIHKTISTPNDSQSPRTESFEYSKTYGRRLLTNHADALGQTVTYRYDPVYSYCISSTDCNGFETHYTQNPFGITQTTLHPDGTVSCKAIRWGSNQYYQWEKETGQATKITYYDKTGEIIRNTSFDINGNFLFTDLTYDALGRISEKTMPYRLGENPKSIQYEYDGHNRINRINHPDGTYETIQYNGDQKSTALVALDGSSRVESKTFNAVGWLIKSTDTEGNSVIYDYYADGKPRWFQIEGRNETRIEMAYDALGNRISLSDPNYGTTTYEYNAFNELTKSISSKSDETVYCYDILGRITQRVENDKKKNTSETTEWHYGQVEGHRGLLTSITSPNQTIEYEYDDLLRLSKMTENTLGTDYFTHYTYDSASRVASITYPSNYTVHYCYTSEGYLKCILDSQSKEIWKTSETNAMMQPTKFVTGNGFVSNYEYDAYTNRLLSINTTFDGKDIQHYSYQYDDFSNMTQRNDLKNAWSEHFTYDALNRLTSATDGNGTSLFSYDVLGRMTEKTSPNGTVFSNADYSGPRPHAIKSAQAPSGVFPQERMDLVFTSFDKISSISEGTDQVTFEYGYDHQRIKTTENVNGKTRSKIYVNSCEFITKQGSVPVVRTFISGPAGIFAVAETINGHTTLHYVHKDHLGSWNIISSSTGSIEQEVHFDAWGNCQDAENLMFDRGYTGHEHIKSMGLINMNGRLYDPVTSSMLSPDNNIQMPDFSQNLNRYAYCFNNPLTYTDPDGNVALEAALVFYLLYCTDFGYELQKQISPVAFHIDLHLSTQQFGIGFDVSVGVPKSTPISLRAHAGLTYYWRYYDNSFQGVEFRCGMEWCAFGLVTLSGTSFYYNGQKQTTNAIILGNEKWSVAYENDYMFHLGDQLLMGFTADNGDRYRTAAAKIRIGIHFQIGVNLFTGDPGVDPASRRTFYDPNVESTYYDEENGGRETYTTGAHGENPNEYRAGVFYVGFGPLRIGGNSEQIRNTFQNRFAHDLLCKGDSPYFEVLDRPRQFYFYFGSGTGNTLW